MKSVFFILIIFLLACSSISIHREIDNPQQKSENKILWSPYRKLTWKDFEGKKRDGKISVVAETAGEIVTEKRYWKNGVPKFDIRCYFLKDKSWTLTKDSLSLKHEQLHFDIYELFTRKIRKSFDSLNIKKVVDFKFYEDLFSQNLNICDQYNKKYDNEVYFNSKKQQEWANSISKELEKLKEYEYIPR